MKTISYLSLLFIVSLSVGCKLEPVKPWERNILAQDKMQLNPDVSEFAMDEHIYFSKEAANGGQGIGGGGCGCN